MPKIFSATCNKKKPAGARSIKTAFTESNRRKGYYVVNSAPVVVLKRGKAKGCVRTASRAENKRIRQANRGAIRRASAAKKSTSKKSTSKKSTSKKSSKKSSKK